LSITSWQIQKRVFTVIPDHIIIIWKGGLNYSQNDVIWDLKVHWNLSDRMNMSSWENGLIFHISSQEYTQGLTFLDDVMLGNNPERAIVSVTWNIPPKGLLITSESCSSLLPVRFLPSGAGALLRIQKDAFVCSVVPSQDCLPSDWRSVG
jgi:hypothetical protein